MRGYYGIGIYHTKTEANVGTLWRTAHLLGAAFIFTIGKRYKAQASDTTKAPKHIPLFNYKDFQDFNEHRPTDCPLIGIELDGKAVLLEEFSHPERAIYILGAEDHGLSPEVLGRCESLIRLRGDYSMNVAVAGSLVMYHRTSGGHQA